MRWCLECIFMFACGGIEAVQRFLEQIGLLHAEAAVLGFPERPHHMQLCQLAHILIVAEEHSFCSCVHS